MKRNLPDRASDVSLAIWRHLELALARSGSERPVHAREPCMAPRFEVDPMWPKPLPNHWVIGMTIGVSVDAQDHIWIIHRQGSLEAKGDLHATPNPPAAECCLPAPPVLEFDQDGNLWAAGAGRARATIGRTPTTASRSTTKATCGSAATAADAAAQDAESDATEQGPQPAGRAIQGQLILKFTQDGKFLMQIGHPGQSKGSNDVEI